MGFLLSGGIDSSLLAALAVRRLGRSIDTFTVGFGDPAYDETPAARIVAKHLGTTHHEVRMDGPAPDTSLVETVLDQFDQPFGDSSAIPTYIVCREIRRHVKVAISGDGGDEMFGGYRRFWAADAARRIGRVPFGVPPHGRLLACWRT